jgi:hypothetical protein
MKDRAKAEDLLVASDLQAQTSQTAWQHVHAEYVDILATPAPERPRHVHRQILGRQRPRAPQDDR